MRLVHAFTRACLGLAALVLVVSVPASAQERKQPRWAPSIEKGLEEAKERGVALMVALNMDNERGNQGMVDNVYTDPKFLKATEKCVVAVGSLFAHGKHGGTGGQQLCERFGSVTCEQHQAIEKVIRQDWLKRGPNDDVESPRHFFLAPDGRMLFQRVWTMRAQSLAELMTRASELCTPGRLANWDSLEAKLERATDSAQSVRETALQELIAKNDAELDQQLADLAKKSKDPMVTGSILASFALADTVERRALAHTALSHKAPEVRMLVAHAMHQSGAADHLPPLVKRAPKERDGKARGEIFRALGEMGKDTDDEKKIVKVLLKSVGNSKDDARAHACVAIAPWIDEKGVTPALQKVLLQGGDRGLRSAAVWAIGYSTSKGVQADLKLYRDGLSRRDWRVKNMTDAAIAKLRGISKNAAAYDAAPERFLPHPAEGVEEEEDDGGRGGGR